MPELGITLLNTRPMGQSGELTEILRQLGFRIVEIPMIEIHPRGEKSLGKFSPEGFDGLFFSSLNGAQQFFNRIPGKIKSSWLAKPVYTLSRKTAAKWAQLGGQVAFFPKESSLRGFLTEFQPPESIKNWLHPCSSLTRLNPDEFLLKNIRIRNLPVYTPTLPNGACELLAKKISQLNGIVFNSGSAVDNFISCLKGKTAPKNFPGRICLFSSGPSASEALENHGIRTYIQAETAGNQGLVEAVVKFWKK